MFCLSKLLSLSSLNGGGLVVVEDPVDDDWWVNLTGTIRSFPPYNLSICFWTKLPPEEEQVEAVPESSDPGEPSLIIDIGTVPLLPVRKSITWKNYKTTREYMLKSCDVIIISLEVLIHC